MKNNKIRNRICFGLALCLLWGGLTACGGKESLSLEESADRQTEDAAAQADGAGEDAQEETAQEVQEKEAEKSAERETASEPELLSVYVCGAVNAPGVYELPAGSRLYQAIDAAGGMREDADRNYLNLAMELADGQKLQVPTEEEVRAGSFAAAEGAESMGDGENAGNGENAGKDGQTASGSGLVNINTADEALLMTLPGIGEAKAKSILAYRQEKGPFSRIEDIMNITGIKQAVFDKIKDAICVK